MQKSIYPSFLTVLAAGLFGSSAVFGQQAGVGIGTATPNPKAALDISADDKGLLIPRLDSGQRVAITTPPDGLMVFQKDGRRGLWYAFGGTWVYIPDAARSVRATNGLNTTAGPGSVGLGGALTQSSTVIDGGTNALELRSAEANNFTIDQSQLTTDNWSLLGTQRWQSLTAGKSGELTRVEVNIGVVTSGNLTLSLYAGEGTSGAPLYTQTLPLAASTPRIITFTPPTPIPISAASKYTIALQTNGATMRWYYSSTDVYPGGRSVDSPTRDYNFTTYVRVSTGLALQGGQVRLTGVGGPGLLNIAADGTIGTQTVASVADNLGNHTATQALRLNNQWLSNDGGAEGLRVDNAGNVGIGNPSPTSRLTVSGDAAATGSLVVDNDGTAAGVWTTTSPALRFGGATSGEGFTSKRTVGGNRYGLDFYTASAPRLSITASGLVGIGLETNLPAYQLDLASSNYTAARLTSPNGLGTWLMLGNTSTGGGRFRIISTGSANGEGANKLIMGPDNAASSLEIDGATRDVAVKADLVVTGVVHMGYTLEQRDYTIPGNSRSYYYVQCPSGMRVMGGGGGHRDDNPAAGDIILRSSGPSPRDPSGEWRVVMTNTSGSDRAVQVYCTCARME